jgi:bacillaene synthase trans-acting acyltransferase
MMAAQETIFMFSGQGSQYFQMGRELYDRHAGFRASVKRYDALAQALLGKSPIEEAHRGDRAQNFDRLRYTHPAIFIIQQALAECLIADGIAPDMTLGASLGTFAAASISGFIDPEQALRTLIAQADAIEANCERGGMTAIVDAPLLFDAPFLSEWTTLAGVNFGRHFVVSATPADLDSVEGELRTRGIVHQRLAVQYAFHSHWIEPARNDIQTLLGDLEVTDGQIPMACCATATLHTRAFRHRHLWDVIRQPIRFAETIAQLERQGAWRYIDVGPSGTLATFAKYALSTDSRSTTAAILTPFGHDLKNYEALTRRAAR